MRLSRKQQGTMRLNPRCAKRSVLSWPHPLEWTRVIVHMASNSQVYTCAIPVQELSFACLRQLQCTFESSMSISPPWTVASAHYHQSRTRNLNHDRIIREDALISVYINVYSYFKVCAEILDALKNMHLRYIEAYNCSIPPTIAVINARRACAWEVIIVLTLCV